MKYASLALNDKDDSCLETEEILPLGIHACNSMSEYVLGWAFEENRLSENAVSIFKNNFPEKHKLLLELKNSQ